MHAPLRNKLQGQGRIDVLSLLERATGNVGVELGVARGEFSRLLAESGRFDQLFGIDAWADHHDVGEYKEALRQVGLSAPARYTLLRMTFDDALDLFDSASLDFVYIDGYADTGQEGGETIWAWASKVRLGGVVSGHDYSPGFPLVVKAVDRFVEDTGFALHVTADADDPYPTWAVIKTSAVPLKPPADLQRVCQRKARAFRRRLAVAKAMRYVIGRRAT